jgi:hypothetical protein
VAILAVLAAGTVAPVLVGQQPALATCPSAHVYLIRAGVFTKFQSDPIDGPTYDFSVPANTTIVFELGGNGLKSDEDPFWDVYDQNGGYVRTLIGSRAGGCVSNQRSFTISGSFGSAHTFRATYQPAGGGVVWSQAHFRFIYNILPEPDPDPDPDPDPCPGVRICPLPLPL